MKGTELAAIIAALAIFVGAFAISAVDAEEGANAGETTPTAPAEPETPVTYTVTFDVDGTVYSKAYTTASITLPTLSELGATVPAGEEFKGWKSASDDATIIAAGSTVTIADKDAYKAVLSPVTYTVTFDVDGIATTQQGTYGTALVKPADPAKAGYNFLGWSLDGETVADLTDAKITASVTYKALWIEDFAVSFDVNGTTITGGTVSAHNVPTVASDAKEGYSFVGWSFDGAIVEDVEAVIKTLTAPAVFVAEFAPIDCIVTFFSDGEPVLTQTVKYNAFATEPKTVPVKDGFDFKGWDFDFSAPIVGDTAINAIYEPTPEPEKTGLDNPVTLTLVIALIVVIGVLAVLAYLKRDVISAKIVKKLDKPKETEDKKEGEQ